MSVRDNWTLFIGKTTDLFIVTHSLARNRDIIFFDS